MLLAVFTLTLVSLTALEAIYNDVTWLNLRNSILFFLQLWLLVAVPTIISLRLLRERKEYAWAFLSLLTIAAALVPYAYCAGWFSPVWCGAFGSFDLPVYWTGATILVAAVAGITWHDSKRL